MATTTNYGWTTPDNTALVKDGASAIRTLGSSIDTTVFNNASAAIAKTIVDAKGDLIAATAADTVARLAVGSNDQVLIADSTTATGLKWGTPSAGGMTLLSTTTLSGATTTINSISGSYTDLFFVCYGLTNATANGKLRVAPNGTTNITTHIRMGDTASIGTSFNDYWLPYGNLSDAARTNSNQVIAFTIRQYSNTSFWKPIESVGTVHDSGDAYAVFTQGIIETTSAITSLVFSNTGGSWTSGTVLVYGVK